MVIIIKDLTLFNGICKQNVFLVIVPILTHSFYHESSTHMHEKKEHIRTQSRYQPFHYFNFIYVEIPFVY